MNYEALISPRAAQMRPSGIRKFFDIAAEMKDCISLGVGEPDFKTPWPIRDAGIRSLERGRTFYTSNSGLKELREEICTYLNRRFGLAYTAPETLVTVGGSEAIDLCVRALVQPGDTVLGMVSGETDRLIDWRAVQTFCAGHGFPFLLCPGVGHRLAAEGDDAGNAAITANVLTMLGL